MSVRVELRRDAGKIDAGPGTWVRARQVAKVLGPPDPAAVAVLVDHRGRILGHGLYSPDSRIVLRLLSAGEAPPQPAWLPRRLDAALGARRSLGLVPATTGYREVNSEGDGLPGLVVDRFGDWRVVQITTAPMFARRAEILASLRERAPLPGGEILLLPERAAKLEGFPPGHELHPRDARDATDGGARGGPEQLEWRELGRHFVAPAPPAQKTGAYHDQRDNRERFAALVCAGVRERPPRVLDLGCHVGGFALAAAARGAQVVAVDQSRAVLAFVAQNAERNGLEDRVQTLAADMFGALDDPALAGPEALFDGLIFDPPKIASGRKDLGRAVKAMARTLARLLPRLRPDALIGLCSCSQHLGWDELDQVLRAALGPQHHAATRVARWGAGLDHPVALDHAAGEYLRVAVYQRRRW